MKLIGIAPRMIVIDQVKKLFVNQRYLDYLALMGLQGVLLPLYSNDDLYKCFDGFLIPGGDDIDPEFYHEAIESKTKMVDKSIDNVDFAILKYAKNHQLPLLGICRGFQVINVGFNGSLMQDIPNHLGTTHLIKLEKNRLLETNHDLIEVNSYHHQAIKKLGDNLKVVAKSLDGIDEIIIHESLPILGVEFHPEINATSKLSLKIIKTFAMLINR